MSHTRRNYYRPGEQRPYVHHRDYYPSGSRSVRSDTRYASNRMMDVVEIGALGLMGAGLIGAFGSAFHR